MFDADVKEQIRAAVDLVDLISASVRLERRGKLFVGHCPWHEDRRPSFTVDPARQTWKCWVCDVGGDLFSFVQRREGLEFRPALELLAERAGISLTPRGSGPRANLRQQLHDALRWAEDQFHRCLVESPQAEAARAYLDQRGITEESIQRFRLGFSPPAWQWLCDRARGSRHDEATLEQAGLIRHSDRGGRRYDFFRGRLMFAIHDSQGRSIAFGGRVLPGVTEGDAAKYINSAETPVYNKSGELYGLDIARDSISKAKHAVIVEGYTDVILAHQCGFPQAVAVCGTSLTREHIQLLRRFADRVTLLLDGDAAGQRRTSEILELFLTESLDLRVAALPAGLDPADLLLEQGPDALRSRVEQAADALEFKRQYLTTGIDPLRDTHAAHAALEQLLAALARAWQSAPRGSEQRLRAQQMLSRLAQQFQLAESELRTRLDALLERNRAGGGGPLEAAAASGKSRWLSIDPWERELLSVVVQRPDAAVAVLERISDDLVESREVRALLDPARLLAPLEELSLERLMDMVDEPALKSLLVDADRVEADAGEDPEERVAQLLAAFAQRQIVRQTRQVQGLLESRQIQAENEVELLEQIIAQQRKRHGLSASKER